MLDFIQLIQSFATPFTDLFLTVFNMLSQQYFLVFLVALIYWTIDKQKGEQLAYSLLLTINISCGIKGIFKIPRPYTYEGIRVLNKTTAPGYSFPSADSSAAASVAFTIGSWVKKPWVKWLLAIYVILIGFCRIYFGLHFPTDVLAGFLIGVIIAYCIKKILSVLQDTFKLNIILVFTLLLFALWKQEPDYYKTLGLILGAVAGIEIEHKFVNFSNDISLSKKVLRLILGLVGIIIIAILTSHFMPEGNIYCVIEKFFLTFFAVGVYPWIFKRFGF